MDCGDEARMPYLLAIQKVPGDTPGEKLNWINRCAHQQTGEAQLPSELLPLYRVEVAVRTKDHEEITSALKSENLTLVNRALTAAWFFDGSRRQIIDDAYFAEHVFPHVSVNTRKRIVNALAYRTIGRDPEFAQRMYAAVESLYDIQTAYPLLLASGEKFALETIVEKNHALPCRMMKKMWRAYPNLVVRYLKLLPQRSLDGKEDRSLEPFGVTIHKYESFLRSLVKKRPRDFAELCVRNWRSLPRVELSNTAAEVFLKKEQSYLVKYPQVFIDMLPRQKINAELMKTVFPSLLPKEKNDFDTDSMLAYLEYYPKDRRWKLLYKSYTTAYGTELVNDRKNVTFKLLQVLPAEERVRLARLLIENDTSRERTEEKRYDKCLICYLPTDEAIPAIKEKINYASDATERHNYVLHMLYNCRINDDNDALADTLVYFLQKHRNEDSRLFDDTMSRIHQFFDVPHLSKKICSLICDIVQLSLVKHGNVNAELIEALAHHRLAHDMPITDLIKMIIDARLARRSILFDMLTNYPEYERQCLVTFLELMEHQGPYTDPAFVEHKTTLEYYMKRSNLVNLIEAMYAFNDRCEKSKTKIERLTITGYPWLRDEIKGILQNTLTNEMNYRQELIALLKKKELKFYNELHDASPSSMKTITSVTSGEVLRLLTRDPQSVANDWQEYFKQCSNNWRSKFVQRFVKATRWHKRVPVAFAERCLRIVERKTEGNLSFATVMLSLLLHGDSLTKLMDPLLPTETTIDAKDPDMQKRYELVQGLCRGMKLSNPPVPLDLVARICRGDYLSTALWSVTSVSRRTSVPKVKVFAQTLLGMRIGTRKHGIAVMSSVTSARQQIDFFREMWTAEKHHSMREALFENVHKLFVKTPTAETWNLYAEVISTLNDKDVSGLFKSACDVPHKYIDEYLKVWFDMLDKVADKQDTIERYLESLTRFCDVSSEELVEKALKRFLFCEDTYLLADTTIPKTARRLAIAYLSPDDKNKLPSRVKTVMDIICNAVRNRWDVCPPNSSYFPVNTATRELIFDLVCCSTADVQVIDGMLTIFSSLIFPVQLAESYLLLTYAKRLMRNCTAQEARDFGLKLGQGITDIVIFSPLSVPFMADVLGQFLTSRVASQSGDRGTGQPTTLEAFREQREPALSAEEVKLNVIEGLVEAGNSYSCFTAITLLQKCKGSEKYRERYNELIKKFREMKDPAILIVLCNYLNKYKP